MSWRFEWDPAKARGNELKHGISFEEAQTAFTDLNARLIHDPDQDGAEERFLLIGFSVEPRLLIVCHCYRHEDVIRIISARRATKREESQYAGD